MGIWRGRIRKLLPALLVLEGGIAGSLRSRPLVLHWRPGHAIVGALSWHERAGLEGLVGEGGRRGGGVAVLKALGELAEVKLIRVVVVVKGGRVHVALREHGVALAVGPLVHPGRNHLAWLQAATWSARGIGRGQARPIEWRRKESQVV